MNILYIFIGGGVGSLLRYGITLMSKSVFHTSFPFGTLLSNFLSCVAMGLFIRWGVTTPDSYRALLITGLCGGFSTFSSFSLENVELARSGNWALVAANIAISILSCFFILYQLTRTTTS